MKGLASVGRVDGSSQRGVAARQLSGGRQEGGQAGQAGRHARRQSGQAGRWACSGKIKQKDSTPSKTACQPAVRVM